jgi:hypothetical protein
MTQYIHVIVHIVLVLNGKQPWVVPQVPVLVLLPLLLTPKQLDLIDLEKNNSLFNKKKIFLIHQNFQKIIQFRFCVSLFDETSSGCWPSG